MCIMIYFKNVTYIMNSSFYLYNTNNLRFFEFSKKGTLKSNTSATARRPCSNIQKESHGTDYKSTKNICG